MSTLGEVIPGKGGGEEYTLLIKECSTLTPHCNQEGKICSNGRVRFQYVVTDD